MYIRQLDKSGRFLQDTRSDNERILENIMVDTAGGCWLWESAIDTDGYGAASRNGKYIHAHRLSYLTFIGPLEDGQRVCHRCDIPCCVNPAHLFAGTAFDNTQDMDKKGRRQWAK